MSTALALTADPLLADELARLAAAAGVPLTVSPSPAAALSAWAGAPVVLVGADLLGGLLALAPARRAGVHVVTWSPPPDGAYRDALLLGAQGLVELPVDAAWVAEALTDLGDGGGAGLLVGVVGGSGGAGATTFACALGQVAALTGPTLVVDLDPHGPGCDRVLALDDVPGVRWDSLGRASGRLSARSLRDAVPRSDGPGVLAFPSLPAPPEPAAVREALSAARRGHDTVVADLPRATDASAETLARCDVVVVLVVPSLAGVTSAARVVAGVPDPARVGLVVRGRGADPGRVSDLVGAPVLASMPDQRGLAESLDLGLGPVRSHRAPLARAARSVLAATALPVLSAAA